MQNANYYELRKDIDLLLSSVAQLQKDNAKLNLERLDMKKEIEELKAKFSIGNPAWREKSGGQ